MKVLILSTYEHTGGAAIAASRLMHALRKSGVEANMLCRSNIAWWPKGMKPQSWTSIWERFVVWTRRGFRRKDLWAVDIANCGQDITKTQEYKEADVIHLHWVNQGFLSLRTIERIVRSGKRVVWTMHDEWPLEGVHHYTYGTTPHDRLNSEVTAYKRSIYNQGHITFVACSRWLRDIARQKPLGKGQEIVSIPNPIHAPIAPHERGDIAAHTPPLVGCSPPQNGGARRGAARGVGRQAVLFVCQKTTDKRKGLDYLIEAARQIEGIEIVLVGADTDATAQMMPPGVKVHNLGTIRDHEEMTSIYAACGCFVTPSLQDNLPNTIMEAMAAGTPCVGFNVGGIPEMIDHLQNGYVATYKDADDLARGIRYVLAPENRKRLALSAREKVERCYSEEVVARQYIEVYKMRNAECRRFISTKSMQNAESDSHNEADSNNSEFRIATSLSPWLSPQAPTVGSARDSFAVHNPVLTKIKTYPLSTLEVIAIWTVCMIPIPETPLDDVPLIDKWTHFVMYGSLTLLIWTEHWWHASTTPPPTSPSGGVWAASPRSGGTRGAWCARILFPIIMGGAIELAQKYLTTCRSGEWLDFLSNALGSLLGLLIALILRPLILRLKSKAAKR